MELATTVDEFRKALDDDIEDFMVVEVVEKYLQIEVITRDREISNLIDIGSKYGLVLELAEPFCEGAVFSRNS